MNINLSSYEAPTFEKVIRFLIQQNIEVLSNDDLINIEKVGNAIEKSHWDYEDNFADIYPCLNNLKFKPFVHCIAKRCPKFKKVYPKPQRFVNKFYQYKKKIPVCGCIIINEKMTKVLLVTDFKNRHYTFPRGKISKDESTYACAIREVYEEIGYDMRKHTSSDSCISKISSGRLVTMYIAHDVSEKLRFHPKTKKEIDSIQWCHIDDIGGIINKNKTYDVKEFVKPIRDWILKNKLSTSLEWN